MEEKLLVVVNSFPTQNDATLTSHQDLNKKNDVRKNIALEINYFIIH